MASNRQHFAFLLIVGVCLAVISVAESTPLPSYQNGFYSDQLEDQPEEVLMELIARLGQTLMRNRVEDPANTKRTVDFGLARGFSGIQEAKHRMGLAAANFAGGPGRKRRAANTPAATLN